MLTDLTRMPELGVRGGRSRQHEHEPDYGDSRGKLPSHQCTLFRFTRHAPACLREGRQ
jgi:hypothetical protein